MNDQLIADALVDTGTTWGSSRTNNFHTCEVAEDLTYRKKLRVVGPKPEYFVLGSLVHGTLRYVQEGVLAGEERDWKDVLLYVTARPEVWPPDVTFQAEGLLGGYFDKYGTQNAGWPEDAKIAGVEVHVKDTQTFDLPCETRLDTVLKVDDTVCFADHKTRAYKFPTGFSDDGRDKREEFLFGLRTNPQFIRSAYLCQRHYRLETPPTLLVNGFIKTKVPSFERLLVSFSQEEVDRWVENHKLECRQMKERQATLDGFQGRPPVRNYAACAPAIGFPCRYIKWCHGTDKDRREGFE